jgi:uncharacterized protein DUF4129
MEKPRQTLADFVAIAISPALIMALVGSLVFFLLEILYVGQYQKSLQWTLFFFVFGAVLIARISMTAGIEDRAGIYGLFLGLLVWLALLRYVEYPSGNALTSWGWAINLGLIAFIWWCAHKLTWDCTCIDDEVDASGEGLMQAAGLDKPSQDTPEADASAPRSRHGEPATEGSRERSGGARPKKTIAPGGLAGWWLRYCEYQERRRKKPHAPGVWVVYFSLAALPLFGLCQTQIPVSEVSRRQYSFLLLCIYVASGLGLLLTTCFLGLRRYLRQRNLKMPIAMTGTWLLIGGILIALVLLGSAILPRPHASQPLLQWTGLFSSRERDPSRYAVVGEGKRQDSGHASKPDKNAEQESASRGKNADSSKADDSDKSGGRGSKGGSSGGNNRGKSQKSQASRKSNRKDAKNPNGDKQDGGSRASEDQDRRGSASSRQRDTAQQQTQDPGTTRFSWSWLEMLAPILKWIVIGLLIAVIAFYVLRAGLRFLANFTLWARRLLQALHDLWLRLQGLLAWLKKKDAAPDTAATVEPKLRPFSDYSDPFRTGRADQMSNAALVRYTFDAVEAWAREHDLGRQTGETPLEFAGRLGAEAAILQQPLHRLTDDYVRIAYARATLAPSCRDPLRRLWELLAENAESRLVDSSRPA